MKGEVLSDGKFRSEKEVPRGPPVLLTDEEWHQRGVSLRRNKLPSRVFISALVFFPSVMIIAMLFSNRPFTSIFLLTLFYWAMFRTMDYVRETYQSNREIKRQNYSGLFEHGIQVRLEETHMFFFVPYAEITGFRVKQGWFGKNLELDVRGMNKPFVTDDLPEILGAEGLDELRKLIRTDHKVLEMPKLVLYGESSPATMTRVPFGDVEPRAPIYSTRLQF